MVSTPWISETIKELERQLKVTLFLRTTRSVELTDVGRVFSGLLARGFVQWTRRGRLTHEREIFRARRNEETPK